LPSLSFKLPNFSQNWENFIYLIESLQDIILLLTSATGLFAKTMQDNSSLHWCVLVCVMLAERLVWAEEGEGGTGKLGESQTSREVQGGREREEGSEGVRRREYASVLWSGR
jgi:hypothetical protein